MTTPPAASAQQHSVLGVEQHAQLMYLKYWADGCQRVSVWTAIHVVAVVGLLWPVASVGFLLAWVSATAALRVLIHKVARVYRTTVCAQLALRRVSRVAQLSFVSSMVHASFLWHFPLLSDVERGIVTFLLVGTSIAAIASQFGNPRTYPYYTAPSTLMVAAAWALVPGHNYSAWDGYLMAVFLILLCALITFGYGRANWAQFEESCAMRQREHALNVQLTEALHEAEQANQAKTRFLAAANHDLRQPLNVINLVVGALRMRQLEPAAAEMVALLNKVSRSLSTQLDGLLDISKLDAGLYRPDWDAVHLNTLLTQAQEAFLPFAREKGLKLLLDLPGEYWVLTDASLLSRVVGNLCHNALKFTERGEVTLRAVPQVAEQSGSAARIKLTVADTGCGIPEAQQRHVFEEFVQLGNSQRDSANGLGLGLSIVKRLCRLLDVALKLESAPGRGTSVHLSLLMADPGKQATRAAELDVPMPYTGRLQGKTVLVIDDDETVRLALVAILEAMGCQVQQAEGLEAAMTSHRESEIDLIVADVRLKNNENGIVTARAVSQACGGVPVLLVSGDTTADKLLAAEAAGFRLCHKPVRPERLVRELSELLPLPESL